MKHINRAGQWPSGRKRVYYRPKGQKGILLPDLPMDHPKFLAAYVAAAGTYPEPEKATTGTIGAAVQAYLASDVHLALAASTRAVWRRSCDDIVRRYGKGKLADLLPRHIRQDLARLDPHPANNRLKVWRSLARFWVDSGLLDVDPARDVRPRRTPDSDGHRPWTRDDFAAFRARWPIGTPQRLIFEVMYQTCAAIGDAVRLGPANVDSGWIVYQRQKSGSWAASPWADPPPWFEGTDDLAKCLERAPRAMVWLTTAQGHAKSGKSAASWFSKAATASGLQGRSAHGIRKGRAAVFRENGASEDQRMAVLGHETASEARRYSRSADLKRTIGGTAEFQRPNKSQRDAGKGQ